MAIMAGVSKSKIFAIYVNTWFKTTETIYFNF
jgi:hypothetical protein